MHYAAWDKQHMRRKSRQLLRHLSAKITWLKSQEEQSTQCIKLFPSLPLCNSFFFKPLTSCCWRGSFTDSDLIKSQTYASRQTSPNNSSRTAALQDNYRILNRTHDCGHKNSISPLMWRKVFCQHLLVIFTEQQAAAVFLSAHSQGWTPVTC